MNRYTIFVATSVDRGNNDIGRWEVRTWEYGTNGSGEGLWEISEGNEWRQIIGTCDFRARDIRELCRYLNRSSAVREYTMYRFYTTERGALRHCDQQNAEGVKNVA